MELFSFFSVQTCLLFIITLCILYSALISGCYSFWCETTWCFVTELEDKYVCSVSIPPSIFSRFASLSFSLHLSFFTEDSVVQTPTKAAKARRFLLPFVLCSHDSPPKGTCCSCVCFYTNPHLLSTLNTYSGISCQSVSVFIPLIPDSTDHFHLVGNFHID